MAARYNSNHFQLLSYRIWEEYRALSTNAVTIPPSSMCTSAPSEPLSTPQQASALPGTVPQTAEMGEISAAELSTAAPGGQQRYAPAARPATKAG